MKMKHAHMHDCTYGCVQHICTHACMHNNKYVENIEKNPTYHRNYWKTLNHMDDLFVYHLYNSKCMFDDVCFSMKMT